MFNVLKLEILCDRYDHCRYLYSDETEVTEEQVVDLIKLAHLYQIPALLKFCAEYMEGKFTDENACIFLDLALFYDIVKLRDDVCRYIDTHAEGVLKSEQFPKVSKACLTYILKGDTLLANEAFIFERTMTWAKEECRQEGIENPDGPKLRETLGEAFYQVRVPTMDVQTFLRSTVRKGLYSVSELERILEFIVNKEADPGEIHYCAKRISVCENIAFTGHRSSLEIGNEVVTCSSILTVRRPCKFRGFQLTPLTIQSLHEEEIELSEHILRH